MDAEEGLFKFKKGRKNQKKKPKSQKRLKKQQNPDGEAPETAEKSFGKVNPKGKIQKRKRNQFPKKTQISDGTKKYDLKQLEEKIATLHAVSEPNKKVRKKIRQLEHLQKKITQIILTQQTLEGEEAGLEDEEMEAETKDIGDEQITEEEMKEMEDEAKITDSELDESDEESDDDETKDDIDEDAANNSDDDEEDVAKEDDNGDKKGSDEEDSDSDKDDVDNNGVKRFVVFVGNLPKDVTKADIKTHFAKVGNIKSIRIPENKETRKSGFAFVELEDQLVYEKTLSMHHTMMSSRRINVMYTAPDSKNFDKKEIMKKNAKLDAMRKSGQLAGSIPEHQRRSFRRKKKRLAEAKAAAEAR